MGEQESKEDQGSLQTRGSDSLSRERRHSSSGSRSRKDKIEDVDLRKQKTTICGLQGSGKTYLAKHLIRKKDLKVLVYSPHKHDFKGESDNFIYYKYDSFKDDIEQFLKYGKKLCQKDQIDGVLIDEMDMVFKNIHDIKAGSTDVFVNHRHYNMTLIGITRRPQDIPAYYFESGGNVISFALQGSNVRKKFEKVYKGMGKMVCRDLTYKRESPNPFVVKEIGKKPYEHPPI